MMNFNSYILVYFSYSFILMFILMSLTLPLAYIIIHPLYLMSYLILTSLLSSLLINFFICKSMIPYMLFMAMVSGMLIVFLYFTSLINNEKYKFDNSLSKILILTAIMLIFVFNFDIELHNITKLDLTNKSTFYEFYKLNYIYLYPYSMMTMMTISHLILTMIFTTKLSTTKFKALRATKL